MTTRPRLAPPATTLLFGALLAAPLAAGTLYVPVLDPRGAAGTGRTVELLIASSDAAQKSFYTTYLTADSDGTARTGQPLASPVLPGRTAVITGAGVAGQYGLLEIDADPALAVGVHLVGVAAQGAPASRDPVPVISSQNMIAAGGAVQLLGLRRDPTRGERSDVGLVNLGSTSGQCTLRFYGADGAALSPNIVLAFRPLSLRYFEDALATIGSPSLRDARVQVSCTQPFYPFATVLAGASAPLTFIAPAPTGASTLVRPGGNPPPPPPPTGNTVVFTADGIFHTATRGNEKKVIAVPVPRALSLEKLVLEMDFVPGPWNLVKVPGNHAVVWLHRGRFRSNTIANVNAFGPDKYTLKNNQNVDLPQFSSTSAEVAIKLEQGRTYHLRYVYDAAGGTITGTVTAGGALVKAFRQDASAAGHVLTVPATGLVAEFGHWAGQEGPEVASYGWSYGNLRIEMVPN